MAPSIVWTLQYSATPYTKTTDMMTQEGDNTIFCSWNISVLRLPLIMIANKLVGNFLKGNFLKLSWAQSQLVHFFGETPGNTTTAGIDNSDISNTWSVGSH